MSLAGLRACEVAGLRPQDLIVTDDGVLLFLQEAKGGGEATVPAHPDTLTALAPLRITRGLWWAVDPQHVSRTVSVHLATCGIAATGHQLRHRAGTDWYRSSGHDLLVTALLLRHATVSSTQIYAQTDPTRPAEVVNLVTRRRLAESGHVTPS